MKGERRRLRGIWRAVVDDPYRKLMAIGLAVLMWYFVNSRIKDTHIRTLPLTVVSELRDRSFDQLAVLLPNEQVASRRFLEGTREIDSVQVILTGPRFLVNAIEEGVLSLFVTRNVQSSPGGESRDVEFLEFTAADIRRDLGLLKDVEIALDPPRVRLEYKIEEDLVVTLPEAQGLLELVVDPALESRALRQKTAYYPGSLRVVGRGADLARLQTQRQVPLFRATFRQSGVTGNKVKAQIELVGDDLDLRIDPPTEVQMELLPQTRRFTLDVPVFVDDLSLPADLRGRYEPEEVMRLVPLDVSGGLLSNLTSLEGPDHRALGIYGRENFRLLVYLEMPASGGPLPENLTGQPAYLMSTGKLLSPPIDRSEYKLAETVTVNLRRKQ